MAAVDTPPGLGVASLPQGTFAARAGPRRLAEVALRLTVGLGALALALAARRPEAVHAATTAVGAMTMMALAIVGAAIRRARVTIGSDGVRWGWGRLAVRMDRERITRVDLYDDAIALRPRRGSTWFLSRRDWDRFEGMRRAVAAAALPTREHARRAPLAARLQSYGRVLDAIVVLATVTAAALALLAGTAT